MNRMSRMATQQRIETLLSSATKDVIKREQARKDRYLSSMRKDAVSKWRHAAHLALRWSRAHYKDLINVTTREHMSSVDCYPGSKARGEQQHGDEGTDGSKGDSAEDLITIHPIIDGRLKDEGRS